MVSAPSPAESEAEAGGDAVGRITVGDFEESFPMDLTYRGVEEYQGSWIRALKRLERGDNATSCLVSSIKNPATSNFVFCWPLYRSGEVVYVQSSLIFLEELDEAFVPDEPWRSVGPRSKVDEDGNEISEWQTTVDELRQFLHRQPGVGLGER
ncbi:hypothetical protein GCM10023086_16960 [Streptomyces venetus]|uniref:CdiI C-terminal domain-containing protein n=1 Tax=Streptomyces venetus TaxID=1701086 RepID=A0ABP8FDM3_9ACTN